MSREKTMRDLLNTLFFSSDPIISSISKTTSVQHRCTESLSEDVRNLLSDTYLPKKITYLPKNFNNADFG